MRYRVLAVFLLVICAKAQFDSGQISGFVRDPSRSVIVGASVTATNEGNGEKHRGPPAASLREFTLAYCTQDQACRSYSAKSATSVP